MMTIDQLLDSVPMNGVVVVYAPIAEVIECAQKRNSALRGEWFDVTCAIKAGRVIAVIARRELWNIANVDNLLASQRMWRRRVQEWRM